LAPLNSGVRVLPMRATLLTLLLLSSSSVFAAGPSFNCNAGPAIKTFGGSSWLVYACDDRHSVVVITAPGSTAAPFYFIFAYGADGYQLHGEGTGNKAATDAAYKELSQLKASEITNLFNDAAKVAK